MDNPFYNAMKSCTDKQYLDLLCRAEKEPSINGIRMPGFPDPEYQINTVGSAGGVTLRGDGFAFYKYIKEQIGYYSLPINENTVILDFGCGFGRMIRFFFKDVLSENIFGIDVDPKMVEICRETLPCGNFSVSEPAPPTQFADHTFDVIFAYSVFSHLRDDMAEKWIMEFSRILKPGGILVVTTRGLEFLKQCAYYRGNPDRVSHSYQKLLSALFSPTEEYRRRYINGEFLYAPTGGGEVRDSSFYGEAVIPKKYIINHWSSYLCLKRFDENILPQVAAVFQKGDKRPPFRIIRLLKRSRWALFFALYSLCIGFYRLFPMSVRKGLRERARR